MGVGRRFRLSSSSMNSSFRAVNRRLGLLVAVLMTASAGWAQSDEQQLAPEPSTSTPMASEAPASVGALGARLDCSGLLAGPPSATSGFAQVAAAELDRISGGFQPGPLGDKLITQIADRVCAASKRPSALPATCASPPAPDVHELRARLISDVISLVLQQTETVARRRTNERTARQALAGGAALRALLREPSVAGLARSLLTEAANLQMDCSVVGERVGVDRDLLVAGVMLWELERRAYQMGDAQLEQLAAGVLVTTGAQAEASALSSLQRLALRALRLEVAQARDMQSRALRLDDYGSLVELYANIAADALSFARNRVVHAPALGALVNRLVHGEVETALEEVSRMYGIAVVDPAKALLLGVRVIRARTEQEAASILARAVLGIGPWSDEWIVGFNLGTPRLETDTTKLALDGKLGYSGERFGLIGKGFLSNYDFSTASLLASTETFGGSADAWMVFNSDQRIKLELRAEFGINLYSTTSAGGGGPNVFSDEDSVIYRGSLLAGFRAESARSAIAAWVGAGYEREIYDQLTIDQRAAHVVDKEQDSSHSVVTARLRGQLPIFDNVLVGRVRADFLRHSITRESLATSIDVRAREVSSTDRIAISTQIEASARAFLDLELAKVFGFVPCVEGGIDYFAIDDETGVIATAIPVVGVGIRRVDF